MVKLKKFEIATKFEKKNLSLVLRFLQNFLAFSENLNFMVGPVFSAYRLSPRTFALAEELFWLTTFKLTD